MGWALLLLAIVTAACLRFVYLGRLPPGLYRDEAFNGLDALGVLDGQHAVYFQANNGREPLFIYLTALSIARFGRSAMAVRLAAAVVGTLTTWFTYKLAASWFGRRVGLLSAWLWAITLWPVHLSRIGLRPILLPPLMAAAFWLGTLAYQRQQRWLWLLAGAVYGAAFYTYLPIRFTPLLLLALAVYLAATNRWRRLWPGAFWFAAGTAVTLAPFAFVIWQQPDLLLGRAGQVSILNPAINGGDFWGTLWRHLWRATGMFLWRGDSILRHNPAGRPVFDFLMALPFLAGLVWCGRHWRRASSFIVLLWTAVLLGPTILAEDAPHFLRAVGVLPAAIMLPAIGLARLWTWSHLPAQPRQMLVILLAAGSLAITWRDYTNYGKQADVAYLFETAAAEMALQINNEPPDTAVFVDERFWQEWSSLPFLADAHEVTLFRPDEGIPKQGAPVVIYAWPYGPLDFVPRAFNPPALISTETGGLAREDLAEQANPLFVRYAEQPTTPEGGILAKFGNQLVLQQAATTFPAPDQIEVTLYWRTDTAVHQDLVLFVHIMGPDGLVAQDDAPPAAGYWPRAWWQPGLSIVDSHTITLPAPFDSSRHQILIGLYDAATGARLPVFDSSGTPAGDSWRLQP